MKSVANPLRYRRQFVLGPRPLPEYAPWRDAEVGAGLVVQVQRDLPLVQVNHAGFRLTLLGYIIDPANPELDDQGVLRELAKATQTVRQAPERAAELTGRFVLIVDDGQETLLFHDPCGLREVFCSTAETDETWCASQPGRIAGLHRLPPNHFLDLRTREVERYWPRQVLRPMDPEQAAQITAQLLRGSVQAAARRFPLALPITAGMASRTVLAATRGIEGIFHYTLLHAGIDRSAPDLTTPRRLLQQLGREHHVIQCPDRMSPEFAAFYQSNVTRTHQAAGAMAEGLLEHYPPDHMMLSGHCSEIARDTFRVSHKPAPDAEALAELMGVQDNPTALDAFDTWIARTTPVAEATGYRLWDLFFWEQETGTWTAGGQSQWDLVHERFAPLNQRGVLRTLLATDPFFRQGPRYELPRRIMQILWPQVLDEPFCPTDDSSRTRMSTVVRRRPAGSGVFRAVSDSMAALLALR